MKTCTTCGAYVYDNGTSLGSTIIGNRHVCPPEWWVWVPDDEEEDDGRMVRAVDPEDAAEEHVKRLDCESTDQLLGDGFLVHVRDGDKIVKVRVMGEAAINYSAEIEEVTGG